MNVNGKPNCGVSYGLNGIVMHAVVCVSVNVRVTAVKTDPL